MENGIDYNAFIEYISQRFDIPMDSITDDSDFISDFGMDSLGIFSLIDDIETEYGLKLEPQDLVSIRKVREIYEYIQRISLEQVS